MSQAAADAPAITPPAITPPAITPYVMVGSEAGVWRIAERFYALMDSEPEYAQIRAMHGADLKPVRQKLFEFLSGWLGGPQLYRPGPNQKCIVSVHAGFAIDGFACDQWLACMRRALADTGLPEPVCTYLDGPFTRIARAFQNR